MLYLLVDTAFQTEFLRYIFQNFRHLQRSFRLNWRLLYYIYAYLCYTVRDYQFHQSFSEIWLIKRGQQLTFENFAWLRHKSAQTTTRFTLESTTDRLLSHHRITNFPRLSSCPCETLVIFSRCNFASKQPTSNLLHFDTAQNFKRLYISKSDYYEQIIS